MFPHTEEPTSTSAAPSISVTVTALARPTSLATADSSIPSPPISSSFTQLLDTPTITNIVLSALEGVQSGVPTRTTPTLTPTTLRNIEHLFDTQNVQRPEVHFNQAGFVPPPVQPSSTPALPASTYVSVDSKAWGGGITTLTQPASVSPAPSSRPPSTNSSAPTLSPSHSPMPALNASAGTQAARRTGGRRPLKDEKLSPEEEERRLMRRERNKQAAARCRKRRLDQTNRLQDETEALEDEREALQKEIQQLQQEREDLEFILAAHKTSCKRTNGRTNPVPVSVPGLRDNEIDIKEEPMDGLYEEAPPAPATLIPPSRVKPPRPTSLNLSGGVGDLGIPIETPSSGLRGLGLNFETMMEGGTGLTPVSAVVGPISTGLTPLNTPVVTTAPSSNCGTQQRSSSAGELASPDSIPPKLVSL